VTSSSIHWLERIPFADICQMQTHREPDLSTSSNREVETNVGTGRGEYLARSQPQGLDRPDQVECEEEDGHDDGDSHEGAIR
jgi:hypothetical protein